MIWFRYQKYFFEDWHQKVIKRILELRNNNCLVKMLIRSQTKKLRFSDWTINWLVCEIWRQFMFGCLVRAKIANNGSCMHFISIFWQEKRRLKPLEKGSMTVIPPVHSVLKSPKMSHLIFFNFGIFHQFLTCLVTLFDLKHQVYKNSPKYFEMNHFWHFKLTFDHSNFARNVEWDFFCDFQTQWKRMKWGHFLPFTYRNTIDGIDHP